MQKSWYGPMVRSSAVRAELQLAASERISAIVYLGAPAMPAPTPAMRDLENYLTIRT